MRTSLFFSLFLVLTLNLFSQNREGTVFYSDVEKTETEYKINIDLYEPEKVRHIEIQLVDSNKAELASNAASIMVRDGKYYLSYNDEETEMFPESIDLILKNEYNDTEYPQINVKLFDENYRIIDYSQKVFY